MSIWCTWEHIGTDPREWEDVKTGRRIERRAERGNVLSYAEGFSNHYPNLDGTHERPAVIALAHIAPWCTPGHEDEGVDEPEQVGGWLRIEIAAPETLNFWRKDDNGTPIVESHDATVVLDVEAATALRDDLNNWLAREHLTPKETD